LRHAVAEHVLRHGKPLVERDVRGAGSLLLPLGLALCVAALATLQVRMQSSPLVTAQAWNSLPLGRDPATIIAALLAAAFAFRVVVTRTDLDRESGWLPVMHAQGVPAWSYALAVWAVAVARALLLLLMSAVAIQLVRVLLPPPEWADSLSIRSMLGAAALAADVGAYALAAACLARGAARITGLAATLAALPLAVISASVVMRIEIPTAIRWALAAHVPPLSVSGPWMQLSVQLAHTSVLLALGIVLAGSRLTRLA
jgi:hypothetical protein